jgi:hypothetical protein
MFFLTAVDHGMQTLILQVCKKCENDDTRDKAFNDFRHIFIVDEYVNPQSSEDIMWALTTRSILKGISFL